MPTGLEIWLAIIPTILALIFELLNCCRAS